MDTVKQRVDVPAECAIHDAIRAIAQDVYDRFGVRISSVELDWTTFPRQFAEPSRLGAVRVVSDKDP